MTIITTDYEVAQKREHSRLFIVEKSWNNQTIGYNLELDGTILDTYNNFKDAQKAQMKVFKSKKKIVCMSKINRKIRKED